MKYHIVSGDSSAGSLKYYFKKNNINDVIINHFDDLSVWPIHINFQKRCTWIKEKLFFGGNIKDAEEITQIIIKTHKIFLEYIKNLTEDDEIFVWHGENIIENLMLYRVCDEIKKWKLYNVNVSNDKNQYWHFPRSVWECSPNDLWKIMNTKLLLWKEEKQVFANSYKNIVNKKSYLRILENGKVKHVDQTYYDEELLKYIPNNDFISAWKAIWNVMWNSNQVVLDSVLQYRLKYLIDNKEVLIQWKLDNMRTFKIKRINENV